MAEKSLTEKNVYKQTAKQTHIITEKAKNIPPIFRTGGIMRRYIFGKSICKHEDFLISMFEDWRQSNKT